MQKVTQNLVFLIEPSNTPWDISLKAGNMALNLFHVDEESAFESSGIFYLQEFIGFLNRGTFGDIGRRSAEKGTG